jgi:hypothetical protein
MYFLDISILIKHLTTSITCSDVQKDSLSQTIALDTAKKGQRRLVNATKAQRILMTAER